MENPAAQWPSLSLEVPVEASDEIAAYCHALGSCGGHAQEQGDTCRLTVYFENTADLEGARDGLGAFMAGLGLSAVPIEQGVQLAEDWESEWRRFFGPVWVTPRIVVRPSWTPVALRDGQLELIIDPQMAFGTGGHESTRLCLQACEEIVAPGDRCLDLGTGSGVLAIAALRLGADRVVAVDTDPLAVANARANLEANGVGGRATVLEGSVEAVEGQHFDCILANILSRVLLPLLPAIKARLAPGGKAVFSGLLVREEQEFVAGLRAVGLAPGARRTENDWLSIVAGG